ncbi:hypothetical protein [Rhodoplanes sp. SY1]|uniref:hypothetical protein n=1 Tax=Rhodoplanes sp. SY1 TaxID=3166646 RepID=UPI0038B58201
MSHTTTQPVPADARQAELFAMFEAMSFDNMLEMYEIAVANEDEDIVAAADAWNGHH